jgi:5-methylcytosine-specific restriction endonuclease McrA
MEYQSSLKRSGSTTQWRKIRERVLIRDEYTCGYCGMEATEVDHIVQRKDGGLDFDENLIASCKPCNLARNRKGGSFFDMPQTPKPPRGLLLPENASTSHVKGI